VRALSKPLRFTDWPVRRKLAALLVAASLLPLGISAVLDIRAAREGLHANAAELLAAHADHLREQIDAFHRTYELTATKLAQIPALIALAATPSPQPADAASVREIIGAHSAIDVDLRGIGVVGRGGQVIVATEPRLEGLVIGQDYVKQALRGASVISDVHFGEPALDGVPVIAYAAPVSDGTGPTGVVVLWARAEALGDLVRASNDLVGPGSFAVVLDQYGIRIAHAYDDAVLYHPAGPLAPDERRALVAARRFGAETQALLDDVRPFPEPFARARAASAEPGLFRGHSPVNQQRNHGVARRLAAVPWTVFYLLPERLLDDQIAAITSSKVILACVIMLVAFGVGLALAAVILRPVVSLSAATTVIADGDLSARVSPVSADEIGRLCESFNVMAERLERDDSALRRTRDELEERVAERTAELVRASITEARARAALEASTARLEILSRTAHELAAASGDTEGVLELAAGRLGEVIGEACAIRLISEDGGWLETSRNFYHPDPEKRAFGRNMLGSVRQRLGEGPGGRVAESGEALLIPEITVDQIMAMGATAFRPLIEKLAVCSLLTLPLRSRDRTIGVVNLVRSTPDNPYTIDDQRFAQDVADRAGLAIDNAVLVETLERRVEARTAALEAANQELEAFSYSVSHDLRAPLRAIDGFGHALLTEYGAQLGGEGQRYLERIRAGTQRMATLIDDLLNLARITRQQMRRTAVDLTALAGQVAAELRRRDPERTTPIHVAPEVAGRGDARLLTIVLENLIGNAWKFTTKHQAAEIWFGTQQRDGRPVYYVRDSGAGFDMKHADKLFLPFHRLHGTSDYEGTGIGLATVQRIITRHGGQIWAEAEVDRGATFWFTLGDLRS
jgi:signal transduction histidine kinase